MGVVEKTPLTEQITAIPNPMRCSKDSACGDNSSSGRVSSSCTDSSNEACNYKKNKKAESKIISTNNGRITTALNITLTSSNNSNSLSGNRSINKLELTNKRMINMRACDLLPPPTRPVGRASPGLLSDPSDFFDGKFFG